MDINTQADFTRTAAAMVAANDRVPEQRTGDEAERRCPTCGTVVDNAESPATREG